MKTMDPAADARFDPVAPVALERFRKLARLAWRGFRSSRGSGPSLTRRTCVQMKDIQSNAVCVGVEPTH